MNGEDAARTTYRLTTPGMRAILWVGALLVATAGAQLYLLSTATDRFFAWTIKAPLRAAFLWLTLLASLLHLGLFHLTSGPASARGAAWLWLLIYALDPPALTLLWFAQTRAPGRDRAVAADAAHRPGRRGVARGFGVVLPTMFVENDWDRARPALGPSVALVALQAVALARSADVVAWSSPRAWIYVAMLAGILVLGAGGWLRARAPAPG